MKPIAVALNSLAVSVPPQVLSVPPTGGEQDEDDETVDAHESLHSSGVTDGRESFSPD